MSQDSIPEKTSNDGCDQDSTDKNASYKSGQNSKKNLIASKGNKRTKPKSVWLFAFLELLALVFWMLAELFHEKQLVNLYGLFLWIAMAFFLAGAAHVANKALKRPLLVWGICSLLSIVLAFVVFKFTRPLPMQPPKEEIGIATSEWEPPELPKDAKFVNVILGGDDYSESIDVLRTNPTKSIFHLQGSRLPFNAYVKSNRFYIEVDGNYGSARRTIRVTEGFGLYGAFHGDRNNTSNALEVVKEWSDNIMKPPRYIPILQIVYKQPNEISLNGVFWKNSEGFAYFPRGWIRTNNFDYASVTQKPIFKYPSWKYPGKYADE
jgi:hypothetical protein